MVNKQYKPRQRRIFFILSRTSFFKVNHAEYSINLGDICSVAWINFPSLPVKHTVFAIVLQLAAAVYFIVIFQLEKKANTERKIHAI